MRDRVGNRLPLDAEVLMAFAGAATMDEIVDSLRAARAALVDLESRPCGKRLDGQAATELKEMAKVLDRHYRPHAVCPACEARRIGKCAACGGRGWVPESVYDVWQETVR
jgi:hypothetical protein